MNDYLSAFSNVTRLRIILCIGADEKNVSELINHCTLSQSAVSQHLMKLKDAGIIECRKEGREQLYRVRDQRVVLLSKELLDLAESQKTEVVTNRLKKI